MTIKAKRMIIELGLGMIARMTNKQMAAGVYFMASLLSFMGCENCEIDLIFALAMNLAVATWTIRHSWRTLKVRML